MTFKRGSVRWWAAGVSGLIISTLTLPLSAQSLGQVARDEAARRKATTTSGKTYTNANLPAAAPDAQSTSSAQSTPATAAPAPAAAPPTAAADSKGAGKTEPVKKDEAYWRGRMKAIRDAKVHAESFADALQSRINGLSTDFVNRDDPAQRNAIAADRQKAIDELARVKKEIPDQTKAIDDLQTEARREGVPAGWVR